MESHMEWENDFPGVRSREELLKVLADSDEKKKKRHFRTLFEFLSGGDSPIEALELALGRDKAIQDKQMKVMSVFSLWADESNSEIVQVFQEKKKLFSLLSSCFMGKLAIRLILVNPLYGSGKVSANRYLHYHCLNMLQCITDERYVPDQNERVRNFKFADEYDFVPRLVGFLDPEVGHPLTMYHASVVLKNFLSDNQEAGVQFYRTGGLRKCLHFMTRKVCKKLYMDYYKSTCLSKASMHEDEVEILQNFSSGKRTMLKRLECFPRLLEYDYRKECFLYMAEELRDNCCVAVFKFAVSSNKLERRQILLLKPFMKVLNKWLWVPCIWRTEISMLQFSFNILRVIVEDAPKIISLRDLIKNYNILEVLEKQIYNPEREVLVCVVNLLGVVARQYPECRKSITGNPTFVKIASIYINSYDEEIQIGALQTICTFVQLPSTAGLVLDMGITPEKMHLLGKYDVDNVSEIFQKMKGVMAKNCPLRWRESERMFRKTCLEKKYNLEKAKRYKEEGNMKFKEEKYEVAAKCYTLGLECTPPVENFGRELHQHKTTNWFVLPSVLFTNRAQCYLSMNKWQEAIDDCTSAIVRSLQANEEARKILFKTVFRRAKAFMEVKDYHNALNDISFCLRRNTPAANVRCLFREILTLYRQNCGIEPMRRCGACMGGEGMKLKRCAKCPEVYCSRECQTYAWEEGHKSNCNYSLEASNGDKNDD